jgi:hypothetical protein
VTGKSGERRWKTERGKMMEERDRWYRRIEMGGLRRSRREMRDGRRKMGDGEGGSRLCTSCSSPFFVLKRAGIFGHLILGPLVLMALSCMEDRRRK